MIYEKQPVIFDTDIGDDIDDTWALLYLLKSETLDTKLIVNSMGHPDYRLKIAEKFLHIMKMETELASGVPAVIEFTQWCRQQARLDDFESIRNYGVGVDRTVDIVMNSREKVNIISVGTLSNVAAMLAKEPRTAERIRLFMMGGSIYEGFEDNSPPFPEANIVNDTKAAQYVFSDKFAKIMDISMSPLDSSRHIKIDGDNYQRLLESNKPEVKALIENYKVWMRKVVELCSCKDLTAETTTSLFDTLPVYMAADGAGIDEIPMNIQITDTGMTVQSTHGRPVRCILKIDDMPGLTAKITNTLLK